MARLSDLVEKENAIGIRPVADDTSLPVASTTELPVIPADPNAFAPDTTVVGSKLEQIINRLTGANGVDRYQLWPEKVVREGLSAAGDVLQEGTLPAGLRREDYTDIPAPTMPTKDSTWLGRTLNISPVAAEPSDKLVEQAQAMSALAGSGGIGGVGEDAGAALGAGPFLRPALKHEGKIYKAPMDGQHLDALPQHLAQDFQTKAMSGDDISHYEFGFMNHKGQFLNREKALDYAIEQGLVDQQAGKYGALTSTLLADSSKPGTAIEAMAKSVPNNVDWKALDGVERAVSPETAKALTHWVGGPPGSVEAAQKEGFGFGIFHRDTATKAFNDPKIRDELTKAYQPLRDQLRKEHGNEVTLYRYHGDIPEGAKPHEVLSFTNDPKVAEHLSGAQRERKLYSDDFIKEKEAELDKTGKTQIDKTTWLEKVKEPVNGKEIEYIAIMRPDGMVTDTGSVKEYLSEINQWRTEDNAKRSAALDKIKAYKVPVDDIMAATDRFGQKEFIVRNSRNILKADSSKEGAALQSIKEPFYSALEHNVNQISQTKMNGDAWLGTLSNKPGVKPEELDWTGLKSFLEENKGKPVTKAQIQEHLANNKVELKEIQKGELKELPEGSKVHKTEGGKNFSGQTMPDTYHVELPDGTTNKAAWRSPEAAVENMLGSFPKTKYHSYQLTGNSNYREMLLTLPSEQPKLIATRHANSQKIQDLRESMRGTSGTNEIRSEIRKLQNENDAISKQIGESHAYKSSHWDEPNILAHVRMNDRNIDGKKSLHLEEIQSDWHQQGRDKGYRSSNKIDTTGMTAQEVERYGTPYWAIMDKEGKHYYSIPKEGNERGPLNTAKDAIDFAVNHKSALDNSTGVPDAPFKKTWHELALKRMLREAAEKGYDRLSWTPGEAQAARYDLSKKINDIQIKPASEAEGGKHVTLNAPSGVHGSATVDGSGKIIRGFDAFSSGEGKNLSDFVGKDLATKILKTEGETKLAGDGLKVGGEGMKGFYDQIIPRALEKIGKEHGVKVKYHQPLATEGQGYKLKTDNGKEYLESQTGFKIHDPESIKQFKAEYMKPVHYIDLPQSLKDTAMSKGFPLFSSTHMFTPVAGNPFEDKKKK